MPSTALASAIFSILTTPSISTCQIRTDTQSTRDVLMRVIPSLCVPASDENDKLIWHLRKDAPSVQVKGGWLRPRVYLEHLMREAIPNAESNLLCVSVFFLPALCLVSHYFHPNGCFSRVALCRLRERHLNPALVLTPAVCLPDTLSNQPVSSHLLLQSVFVCFTYFWVHYFTI